MHTKEELENLIRDANGHVRTLAAIGTELGISRERVRQLLEKHRITKERLFRKRNPSNYCACGKSLSGGVSKKLGVCGACRGTSLYGLPVVVMCGSCGVHFPIIRSQYKARERRARLRNLDGTRFLPFFHNRKNDGHRTL